MEPLGRCAPGTASVWSAQAFVPPPAVLSCATQGGEDLRLDQRIQQLFTVMNGIFGSNPATIQRGMRVGTYAVVPMTPVLGVIEWVKHTMPIKVCGTGC